MAQSKHERWLRNGMNKAELSTMEAFARTLGWDGKRTPQVYMTVMQCPLGWYIVRNILSSPGTESAEVMEEFDRHFPDPRTAMVSAARLFLALSNKEQFAAMTEDRKPTVVKVREGGRSVVSTKPASKTAIAQTLPSASKRR